MTGKKLPIYKDMYIDIKKKIENELYSVGMLLPTEDELGEEYGVSRTTVRRAISLLQKDGLIKVKQGYGTEIVRKKVSQCLNSITSVSESLSKSGGEVGAMNMHVERIGASAEIAEELSVPIGEPIILVSRIQTYNGDPITIAKNYILERFVPGLSEESEAIISLYAYLNERYGIEISRVHDSISAKNASYEEAAMLRTPHGKALIVVHRICYAGECAFECDHVKIIADKYEYKNFFEREI